MTHLKHMERFELDVPTFIPQEVHHEFQVAFVRNVSRHDVEVGSVQEDFAEEFERLSFGDVVLREDQLGV